jgi:hypothetical protein
MATAAENLATAYDNIARQLAEITLNPKPTYSVSGPKGSRNVGWGEHFNNLTNQLKALREQMQKAAGPIEVYG